MLPYTDVTVKDWQWNHPKKMRRMGSSEARDQSTHKRFCVKVREIHAGFVHGKYSAVTAIRIGTARSIIVDGPVAFPYCATVSYLCFLRLSHTGLRRRQRGESVL